jgi:hypothetical protein
MNREDVIRMAWKAGFERLGHTNNDWVCYPEVIERFAALVASAEREACAKVAQDESDWNGDVATIANRIRARGDNK